MIFHKTGARYQPLDHESSHDQSRRKVTGNPQRHQWDQIRAVDGVIARLGSGNPL